VEPRPHPVPDAEQQRVRVGVVGNVLVIRREQRQALLVAGC
jgi:hypothetical protein